MNKLKIGYIAAAALMIGTAQALDAHVQATDAGKQVTLTLEDCRKMAEDNNPYVRNARLGRHAAEAMKGEALAEYFPKVSLNAFSFYAFQPMLELGITDILGESAFSNSVQNVINALASKYGFNPIYSTLKYGVTANVMVMQPLFAGGRIVNGNRLAALGAEAAALQENITTRNILEETENSYWMVVSLEEKLKTLDELQSLVDTLYKDVSSACAAGLATENDMLQVRLKQNEIKAGKIQVNNGIRLSKMNLLNSIGMDYSPYRSITNDSIPYLDDILLTDRIDSIRTPDEYFIPEEEAMAGRDEAKLLAISVEAKKLEKKMATGNALPEIGIGATYGYSDIIDRTSMNGAVFASVKIPISDWGKTAKQMQRHDYYIQQAENEKEYMDSQLVLEIRKLWLDLNSAWEQMSVASESAEAARSSVMKLTSYYEAGLSPLSELLQAQTELRQATDTYVDRCIDYRKALQAYRNRTRK